MTERRDRTRGGSKVGDPIPDLELPDEWWLRSSTSSTAQAAFELGDLPLRSLASAAVDPQHAEPQRERVRSPHAGRSFFWRLCRVILIHAGRSKRIRRTGFLAAVGAGLGVIIIGGVGVIMLDNIVIKRTAELGRLDTVRRTLQVDNALDSAQIARLSAPTRIVQLALHSYGMQETPIMQQFIWLHRHPGADVGVQLSASGAAQAQIAGSAAASPEAQRAAAARAARIAARVAARNAAAVTRAAPATGTVAHAPVTGRPGAGK